MTIEVYVNADACGGTGECVASLPEIFAFDDDHRSRIVGNLESVSEDSLREIAFRCPTSAIRLVRDGIEMDIF